MNKIGLKKRFLLNINTHAIDNSIKLHTLKQLFWECTLRCNLYCAHCGSDCRKGSQFKDMPKEDFFAVIEKSVLPNVNPNETMIILTGGEALMRNDIEDIGLWLYNKGFPWSMVTNAMALDAKRVNSLMRSGMRALTISLDGFEAEHNEIRGHKESFKRAVEAIKLVSKEKDLVWDIVSCITPKSLHYLEEFKDFLYSIGVREWRLFSIAPMGRAKENDSLHLSSAEFRKFLDFIVKCRKEGKIAVRYSCEGFLGGYEGEVRNSFYNCVAGVNVASILVDGSISGCTSIRSKFYQGNIYKDDFWEVWENRYEKYRNREWMRKGECASCKEFKHCRGGGMHLRTEDGELMVCHLHKLERD